MAKRAHGEGSIVKRDDGRWMAAFTPEQGKRKFVYGKSQREVKEKLDVLKRAQQSGLPVVSDRKTVEAYMHDWLDAVKPTVKGKTFMRYEQYTRVHVVPTLGKRTLTKLSPSDIQALYAAKLNTGLSPRTVGHLHTVLHHALADAVKWGLVVRNVIDVVNKPRARRQEMKCLAQEQVRALLEAAEADRLEAFYVLALSTGMRQGELLALKWSDVDLDGIARQGKPSVYVRASLQRTTAGFVFEEPKTATSRRRVNLTNTAVVALRRHRTSQNEDRLQLGGAWNDNDLVFANAVGRPIEAQNLVRRSFTPLLRRAGLPDIRFHDLRHTAATLLLERGVNVKFVSEMLGHASIAITLDLYGHATETMQSRAVEEMDALLSG